MKLVWSPETASKAYIDTIRSVNSQPCPESGVAEFISATAAGWNAQLIVETWSQGGVTATSIGLAIASQQTGGRHVCLVPDDRSRLEYVEAMQRAGATTEVVIGKADAVKCLAGVDFLVVDCQQKDFARVLKNAKLSNRGAVLVCKNASSRTATGFKWSSILDGRFRLVRSVFLPVGKGLDIAHVGTSGEVSCPAKKGRRWISHVDQETGEMHVFRT